MSLPKPPPQSDTPTDEVAGKIAAMQLLFAGNDIWEITRAVIGLIKTKTDDTMFMRILGQALLEESAKRVKELDDKAGNRGK